MKGRDLNKTTVKETRFDEMDKFHDEPLPEPLAVPRIPYFVAPTIDAESLPIGCIVNPVEFSAESKRPAPPEPPKARVIKQDESLPLQILMCFLLGAIFGALFAIALLSCLPV